MTPCNWILVGLKCVAGAWRESYLQLCYPLLNMSMYKHAGSYPVLRYQRHRLSSFACSAVWCVTVPTSFGSCALQDRLSMSVFLSLNLLSVFTATWHGIACISLTDREIVCSVLLDKIMLVLCFLLGGRHRSKRDICTSSSSTYLSGDYSDNVLLIHFLFLCQSLGGMVVYFMILFSVTRLYSIDDRMIRE
jgi:hypothetical protein